MKVSLQWLRRYLPQLHATVQEISVALTSVGLEVEGIEDFGAPFRGLIVAKVLECNRHPEADKLSVTKVFDGQNEIQVVCGAPNVAAGQTVVFAPLGTSLPMADGTELKLKKIKLRGVESSGMICAEDEIGLGDSHDGIMVLDDSLVPGANFADLPGTYDVVYEINVTPNRPDALSHLGVARELARVFQIDLQYPSIPKAPMSQRLVSERIHLDVQAPQSCTRYVAQIIRNVQVGPSPLWLQKLLRSVGLRPISNVVDLSNFILMEWGQPLHAFDLDRIDGSELIIRHASEGESLITLDGVERQLKSSELVIASSTQALCVAGVMGGQSSEVRDSTTHILLETAYFSPSVVRRQARRLGLHSDSSHRFERGIDPLTTAQISRYAAALIAQVCGGQVDAEAVEFIASQHPIGQSQIPLRLSRISQILGFAPSAQEVRSVLTGIGLEELSFDGSAFVFLSPGFRPDLEREIDLIEEVARLIGYDQVPILFPSLEMRPNALPKNEQISRQIRRFLAARGLHEGLSLRFESTKALQQIFSEQDPRLQAVALQNPLSEEWAVLPSTFLGRMLKSASLNLRQQAKFVRLFELAKVFKPTERIDERRDPGVQEQGILTGIVAGEFELGLSDRPESVNFASIRALLEAMFRDLRLKVEWSRPEQNESFLHPLRQAELKLGNRVLGWLGELHPQVAQAFEIDKVAYVWELNLDLIVKKASQPVLFQAFSKFGAMSRDISLMVDERVDVQEIQSKLLKTKAKNLKSVDLRSIYTGPGIPEAKKSLLFQFNYQADDRTLTDEEVNQAHEKLRGFLAQDGEIEFR